MNDAQMLRAVVQLCYKALVLSLLTVAVLVVITLAANPAYPADKCPLPPVPVMPDNYGYRAIEAPDGFIHLFAYFVYGPAVVTTQLNMFGQDDMVKAVKEGMKYRKCVAKEIKNGKLPPPPAPQETTPLPTAKL